MILHFDTCLLKLFLFVLIDNWPVKVILAILKWYLVMYWCCKTWIVLLSAEVCQFVSQSQFHWLAIEVKESTTFRRTSINFTTPPSLKFYFWLKKTKKWWESSLLDHLCEKIMLKNYMEWIGWIANEILPCYGTLVHDIRDHRVTGSDITESGESRVPPHRWESPKGSERRNHARVFDPSSEGARVMYRHVRLGERNRSMVVRRWSSFPSKVIVLEVKFTYLDP